MASNQLNTSTKPVMKLCLTAKQEEIRLTLYCFLTIINLLSFFFNFKFLNLQDQNKKPHPGWAVSWSIVLTNIILSVINKER